MTSRGSTRQKGLFLIPVTFTFSLEHSFPVVPSDGWWMLDPCRVAALLAWKAQVWALPSSAGLGWVLRRHFYTFSENPGPGSIV